LNKISGNNNATSNDAASGRFLKTNNKLNDL
jgi:hypothetical protein